MWIALMLGSRYAYGCNELVFNPIHTWLWRGPWTKLFLRFVFSNIQLSSKISILGYIFSCKARPHISYLRRANRSIIDYALAAGFPLTIMNYFIVGWFNGYLDKYYIDSWKGVLYTMHVLD